MCSTSGGTFANIYSRAIVIGRLILFFVRLVSVDITVKVVFLPEYTVQLARTSPTRTLVKSWQTVSNTCQGPVSFVSLWYIYIFVLVSVSFINGLNITSCKGSNITIHKIIHIIHVLPSYHTSYRTCHVSVWLFHNQCFTYLALWGKSELEGFVMVIFILLDSL